MTLCDGEESLTAVSAHSVVNVHVSDLVFEIEYTVGIESPMHFKLIKMLCISIS